MLKNLVSLVSGGTSNLGRATVNRFAKKGSQVILTDLPNSNGEQIAKEIGENVHFMPADATSEKDVGHLVNNIEKTFGKLNVLVNCLGMGSEIADNQPNDIEHFRYMLQSNLVSTFNMIRLTAGIIGNNEPNEDGLRGVIVNTAGLEGFQKPKHRAIVAAVHGSIVGMMNPIASDLGHRGIRIVTIIPGFNDTSSPAMKELLKNEYVLGTKKFGQPEEFAHMVQTIVLNPYINATTIDLSGGVSRLL